MSQKVSVIMGTYNGAKYLDRQLESILGQTHENIELIIQDDGSTDRTMQILNEYAESDGRIRISQNEKNLGINANFYSLIEKCTGDYIAISDQDDVWRLDKIEKLLSAIDDCSLIYSDSELIDSSGNLLGATLIESIQLKPKQGKWLIELYRENTISGHSCMFRRTLLEGLTHRLASEINQDVMYDCVIAIIASFRNGVRYYERPLTLHRIHAENSNNSSLQNNILTADRDKGAANSSADATRAPRTRQNFWSRRISRAREKITRARTKRRQFEHMFSLLYSEREDPFRSNHSGHRAPIPRLFDVQLYRSLSKLGIKTKDARDVCSGSILFYIFGIF